MVREGFSEKVVLEYRCKGGEGVSLMDSELGESEEQVLRP